MADLPPPAKDAVSHRGRAGEDEPFPVRVREDTVVAVVPQYHRIPEVEGRARAKAFEHLIG